ncbi:MAG: hypothetical protein LBC57_06350, partial [Treponema sp.]|nr:hypothetical protein [Treponema sp.]
QVPQTPSGAPRSPQPFPPSTPEPLSGPADDTPVEEEEAFPGEPADFDENPEALPIDDQGEEDDVFMDEEEEPVAESPYEEESPLPEDYIPEEENPPIEDYVPEEESPPVEEPAVEEEAPDEAGEETADEDAFGGMMEGDAGDEEPLFEDENPEEMAETPDDTEEMMLEGDEDLSPDEIPDDMFDSGVNDESLGEEFPEETAEIPAEESEEGSDGQTGAEEKPDSEIPESESAAPGPEAPPETIPSSVEGIKSVALSDMLGLMNYLMDLSHSLPENERETFMQSDVRVSMEYLIDTMEGHRGLRKDIEDRHNISTEGASGKASLSGTLAYLKTLAGALPDQDLGKAVSRKLETVMSALGKKTHG